MSLSLRQPQLQLIDDEPQVQQAPGGTLARGPMCTGAAGAGVAPTRSPRPRSEPVILLVDNDPGAIQTLRVIQVQDNDTGMSAAQLKHLFEPYSRLGRQSGGVAGAGLGLALSHKPVLAMHASLDAHSEAGRGTVVHIDLPCAQASAKVIP